MLLTAPSLGSGHLDTHLEPLTARRGQSRCTGKAQKLYGGEKHHDGTTGLLSFLQQWVRRIFAIQRESFIKSGLYFSAISHPSELSSFRSGAPEARPARAKFSQSKV
jgi:hypothetical protein